MVAIILSLLEIWDKLVILGLWENQESVEHPLFILSKS